MNPEKELKSVRQALNELHKLVLATLKKERERSVSKLIPPAEWFQTLLNAPEYAWLKTLNSLLSDVDALSESKQFGPHDFAILHHEFERLFFKEDGDVTSFNYHYRKLLANSHDVIVAHGQLRQAYSQWPEAKSPSPANADEIRRGWHKIGASKRKLLN